MPAVKEPPSKIDLSHMRCRVAHIPSEGRAYLHRCERKNAYGTWVSLITGGLVYCRLDEVEEKVQELNARAQRKLNAEQQQKAVRARKSLLRNRRRKAAREEYKRYLDTLPGSADAYKESPDRWRYTGGPDGGTEKRSIYSWKIRHVAEHYPEKAEEMEAKRKEILDEHDLPENTQLT